MIKVKYTLESRDFPVSGFEMGDLEIDVNNLLFSSKAGGSRHLMMIFLSIIELLNGLNSFLCSKKRSYEFVGVDSSFILLFKKISNSKLLIEQGGNSKVEVLSKELIEEVLIGSEKFWKDTKQLLNHNDPIIKDMEDAIQGLKKQVVKSECLV